MPTLAPERTDELVASWLDATDPASPAGPLYLGGKYAEYEITMTGGTPATSYGDTGCDMCTGSVCGMFIIQCR